MLERVSTPRLKQSADTPEVATETPGERARSIERLFEI
jgi:hypothetical protein